MVSQGLSKEQAEDIWRPFLDWIAASPSELDLEHEPVIRSIPARGWWDVGFRRQHLAATVKTDDRPGADAHDFWWPVMWLRSAGSCTATSPPGCRRFCWSSRSCWLFAASRRWRVDLHFNKGLAGGLAAASAATRDTATNPTVLEAFALAIASGSGASAYAAAPDLPMARRNAGAIGSAMAELRKVAPGAGAYVSESSFLQLDWQGAYWGTNYPRLRAVKTQYDPEGLFFVHHGVGSEDWSDDGFTRVDRR
jgi:hypothetical protein